MKGQSSRVHRPDADQRDEEGPTPIVARNDSRSRYEMSLGGRVVGLADFVARGGILDIPHSEVLPEFRGRGLAGVLVGAALDDLRRRGERVIPSCSYVAAFITDHPEYADLVTAG